MYKVAFVILHYETLDDTIECVESIITAIDYSNWQIVIVDNGSKNQSGKIIAEKYALDPRIYVLLNGKNLGFAKGNNAGYTYAKNRLSSDFIVVINSDTLIRQNDFIIKIVNRYQLKKFDILGPDIISLKDHSHQNPRIEVLSNATVVKKYIKYFRYSLILNYLYLDQIVIRIKKFFFPGSKLPGAGQSNINPENLEMEHVKLHGSAVIFSPEFLKKYDYAFFPETFLYCEESILNYFVRKDGLVTVYYPDVIIFHKEDVTSDYLIKRDLLKRRFYLKHNIRSALVLLKLYNTQQV